MTIGDFLFRMFDSMWPWLQALAAFTFFAGIAGGFANGLVQIKTRVSKE